MQLMIVCELYVCMRFILTNLFLCVSDDGVLSPFHTARWSRKIARKLPECLLCERKHIPGLIPGLIPGWGPSNIAGFSPGTSAVWTKAGSMA